MAVTNASQHKKSVADPAATYESMRPLWEKSRAMIGGERFVKDYDGYLDTVNFSNLLLPFSPSMTQQQYDFYKSEAELPGVVSQYARVVVGGLLRKQPQLKLPDNVPAEAQGWLMNQFSQHNASLTAFLDDALWEELQTSRAWIYVDYPQVANADSLTRAETKELKPYPVLWNAESVINWRATTNTTTGCQQLQQVIVRNYEETYTNGEFHPVYLDTVWVHELFEGKYRIRKFQKAAEDAQVLVVNGKVQQRYQQAAGGGDAKLSQYVLIDTNDRILVNGERPTRIPAWSLNGSLRVVEPMLTPLIDREVALYNKMSRRNHLLYGAATYTPIVASDMLDDDFDSIVNGGLGSWIKVQKGDTVTVLETPTDALTDMDRSIASGFEDMAKLGVRMLAPDTAQSGVALDIRNASQTAQLGTLNAKISTTMASVFAYMLNWRYDLQLTAQDIEFEMSADFNPTPLGADWLRLATEWYEKGLIPRSVWLQMIKQNDMLNADYDDEEGQVEITSDGMLNNEQKRNDMGYADKLKNMSA